MSWPFGQSILNALARLTGYYNSGAYDVTTNPGGLDNGGHRVNLLPMVADASAAASAASDAAGAASTSASAAGVSAGEAATSAANAAASESGAVTAVAQAVASSTAAAATSASNAAASAVAADASAAAAAASAVAAQAFSGLPAMTGHAGELLTTNGETWAWAAIPPPLAVTLAPFNTNLVAGVACLVTSVTPITLTLPSSPAAGDTISIQDGGTISLTNQHTLARNGSTIQGVADDVLLDLPDLDVTIYYTGTTWRFV